jgi:hypothetical protein
MLYLFPVPCSLFPPPVGVCALLVYTMGQFCFRKRKDDIHLYSFVMISCYHGL